MPNDLVPSSPGGELTTTEWQLPSAPVPTTVETASTFSPGAGAPVYFFGQPLPAGASPDQVQTVVGEIANAFLTDAPRMGVSSAVAQQAAIWFRSNSLLPIHREWPNHKYRLGNASFGRDEDTIVCFLNFMWSIGASQAEVMACLSWVNELGRQSATPASHARSIDELSDAQFAALERKYAHDAEKAEATLRRTWGYSYESNLAIAQRFLNNLPASDRNRLADDVINGVSALNSPDVIVWLYQQAIGVSGNFGGASLSRRISEIEHVMKNDPGSYFSNEELQAELRHLYAMRGR